MENKKNKKAEERVTRFIPLKEVKKLIHLKHPNTVNSFLKRNNINYFKPSPGRTLYNPDEIIDVINNQRGTHGL